MRQDLIIDFFSGIFFKINKILFFLLCNISNASSFIFGAITTSQNNLLITEAVDLSILVLDIKIPPNAEIGSASSALS